MKKLLRFTVLSLAFFAFTASSAFCQKYGHLNSGNLLAGIPEVADADKKLTTFQDQLAKTFKAKVDAFKANYDAVSKQVNEGTLTPVQINEKEQELKVEQEKLAKEEQENLGKVQQKRQELLQPILDKVDKAIKAVGEENGYTMIFETSMINTVLFAKDSEDVMPLVKKKLGIE